MKQLYISVLTELTQLGLYGGSDGKESARNAEDPGLMPGSGRSLGEGNGNPLQCSCLKNPMDRGVWSATVQESDTTELLSMHAADGVLEVNSFPSLWYLNWQQEGNRLPKQRAHKLALNWPPLPEINCPDSSFQQDLVTGKPHFLF